MPVRVPFPPASEEVVARAGPAAGPEDAPAAVATGVKEIVPEPGRPDAPTIRSEAVSIPRGDPEATVVEPGETLEDVSVRVYGTKAGVETLLRANREVLTRRKGPLRAGLQLWTPPRW
jgi:nucleoid-associated protein YgaU